MHEVDVAGLRKGREAGAVGAVAHLLGIGVPAQQWKAGVEVVVDVVVAVIEYAEMAVEDGIAAQVFRQLGVDLLCLVGMVCGIGARQVDGHRVLRRGVDGDEIAGECRDHARDQCGELQRVREIRETREQIGAVTATRGVLPRARHARAIGKAARLTIGGRVVVIEDDRQPRVGQRRDDLLDAQHLHLLLVERERHQYRDGRGQGIARGSAQVRQQGERVQRADDGGWQAEQGDQLAQSDLGADFQTVRIRRRQHVVAHRVAGIGEV